MRTFAAISLGLITYVNAYIALLQPIVVVDVGHLGMVVVGSREPHYRCMQNTCIFVFAPVEWLDFKIRPDFWNSYTDLK